MISEKQKLAMEHGHEFVRLQLPNLLIPNMQVKEVIISFFILMEQGKATLEVCKCKSGSCSRF